MFPSTNRVSIMPIQQRHSRALRAYLKTFRHRPGTWLSLFGDGTKPPIRITKFFPQLISAVPFFTQNLEFLRFIFKKKQLKTLLTGIRRWDTLKFISWSLNAKGVELLPERVPKIETLEVIFYQEIWESLKSDEKEHQIETIKGLWKIVQTSLGQNLKLFSVGNITYTNDLNLIQEVFKQYSLGTATTIISTRTTSIVIQ